MDQLGVDSVGGVERQRVMAIESEDEGGGGFGGECFGVVAALDGIQEVVYEAIQRFTFVAGIRRL